MFLANESRAVGLACKVIFVIPTQAAHFYGEGAEEQRKAGGRNYITFISRLGASPGSVDGGILLTGASAQTADWMVIFNLPLA